MSGGAYGRGKAPTRACLKLDDWPATDRELWLAAITPSDPFAESGGTRARHRLRSNKKVVQNYGRWLTFLAGQGLLDRHVQPADRITLETVKAYVVEMETLQNRKYTILGRLQDLGVIANAIAPDRDWMFINKLASWVRGKREAPRDKRSRLVGSNELYGLGLSLMAQAATESTPRLAAMAFRDGLMIALLALRPLRRGNFINLTIGEYLVRTGAGWTIILPGAVTKNHAELTFPWPEQLLGPLETYLAVHRPILAKLASRWKAPIGDRLWVSSHGSPMTEMAFYDRITKLTAKAFGKSLNPHLFRDAVATTTAIHDPSHVRLVAALLCHRSFATAERYYQQAQSLEAHRMFANELVTLRKTPNETEQDS